MSFLESHVILDDPEVSHVKHHHKFLKEHVIFKEAIPFKNTTVLSKIHLTYRVGFLKDVVLARVLDEATVANLNSIIYANNAIVVSLLKDDNTFMQELFARLKSPTTSPESKKNMGPRRMHCVMDSIPATSIEIGGVTPIQTVG
ncbi:hypothetical protein JHK82_036373 [Glycine max]|nr:hypothetical protein JHK87_036289 [Glycine soja]KAG4970678.1 hypothetical protein JHK85_037099 [Glycine max]KAG4977085.1 hypothetical protein JHK86_036559 [Glycine max]KAG5113104.1 hypothetical protein JHK82_036373 [Glycine max]KAG5130382.1 hypothetical protein JHK84_036779 [Glycine max]